MERLEGDMSLKNPITPPVIDPGTVRQVAQRLNHYVTPELYASCAFLLKKKKLSFLQKFLCRGRFSSSRHRLENYDGTDRRTVGAYTERSKFVTIFRSLF
jgi:hypothetical protein